MALYFIKTVTLGDFFLILLLCFVFGSFNFKLNLSTLEIMKLGEWQRRGQKFFFFFLFFSTNINKSQMIEQKQYQQEQNSGVAFLPQALGTLP